MLKYSHYINNVNIMSPKCSDLINLYNDLLLKKEGVCNSLNKLDRDNMNWLKYKILEIKNIKENIDKIINPICKFREDIRPQIMNQIEFYKNIFNIDIRKDLKDLKIPEKQEGFDNLLIVPKNISYNIIWNKIKEVFKDKAWIWDKNKSLEELIDPKKEQRDSNAKIYFILIQNHKNNTEVPEDMRNKSANNVVNQETLTLKEALLNYIIYFINTKKYLYQDSYLFCAGSRYSDGDVPVLRLNSGGFINIYEYNVGDCNSVSGPCPVVSSHS